MPGAISWLFVDLVDVLSDEIHNLRRCVRYPLEQSLALFAEFETRVKAHGFHRVRIEVGIFREEAMACLSVVIASGSKSAATGSPDHICA